MHPRTQCRRFLAALACSAVLAGAVAATEYAPLMPRAAQALLLDIAAAGNRAVVAGARGHILYSDDDGSSWQQAKVPTAQMLTGIHFVDSRHGWAVGHDGIIVASDDGGANWRVQRDGIAVQQQTNIELREEARQRTRELERAIATDDAVDRATVQQQLEDAVMDLEDAELALQEAVFTSPLMDVWFLDQRHGWAVGAFGTLLATADGGQHWKSQSGLVNNPDEFHLNTVTGDSTGRVFIAGEGGVMYRSLDSGKTWESLKPVYEGSWFGAIYSKPHNAAYLLYSSDWTLWIAPPSSSSAITIIGTCR